MYKPKHKFINFGEYTDKILQYANETFAVMHHKFLKNIWGNNNIINKLHHNQTFTDWQNGRYETYIPSRDNPEYNLSYNRIVIQVQTENSNDTKHETAYKLMKHLKKPLGNVESELILIIAPRQDRWGLVKGFKHRNKPGYFTAVYTNKSPEIVWKRILDLLLNFTNKRLDGFMKSLGFEKWVWKWAQNKGYDYLYYTILENFSYSLRQSVLTLTRLYKHFKDCMKGVLKDIGVANVAKQVIKPLKTLDFDSLSRVMSKIREELQIRIEIDKGKDKGVRLLKILNAQVIDRRRFNG